MKYNKYTQSYNLVMEMMLLGGEIAAKYGVEHVYILNLFRIFHYLIDQCYWMIILQEVI